MLRWPNSTSAKLTSTASGTTLLSRESQITEATIPHQALSAHCVGNPQCNAPPLTVDFLACGDDPPGCPALITGDSIDDDDCDLNGNRRVKLTLRFIPPIPAGADAEVSWAYGAPDAQGSTTAVDALPTTTEVSEHARIVIFPPRPPFGVPEACSYFASATVAIVIDGELCSLVPVPICVRVDSCLVCPTVTLEVRTPTSWCAPPQAGQEARLIAVVNFPSGTPNPPVPSQFDWVVTTPDGSRYLRQTTDGTTSTGAVFIFTGAVFIFTGWRRNGSGPLRSVDLSQPGTYAVSVTAKFSPAAGLPTGPDGTPSCNLVAGDGFQLHACCEPLPPPTCPSITEMLVSPACADPATGVAANVSFAVTVNDPASLVTGYSWNFGDPVSGGANLAETVTPNATHS